MHVAWYSPMPPLPSGIGEYSLQLVPYVAEHAEVTVVSPRPRPFGRIETPPGVSWMTPGRAASRLLRDAAPIYNLGNNAFHWYCYEESMRTPGVSLFHDIVLHHMVADVLIEKGRDWRRYERIIAAEHPEIAARFVALRRRHVHTDFEKFLFPLFAHAARRAKAIVVHGEEMRDRIAQEVSDVPIHIIPHFAPPRPEAVATMTKESARRVLGLPPDRLLVGSLGYVTLPKQPIAMIEGLKRLLEVRPDALLLLVGPDRTGPELRRAVARFGVADKVIVTGIVDLIRFYKYLIAVDFVINLRYPTVVETSGTNARTLAEGRPLIVSNVGAFAELPDDAVMKVEIDEDQGEAVGRHLIRLATDAAFRDALVSRALEYARTHLDARYCAKRFVEVAQETREAREPARIG